MQVNKIAVIGPARWGAASRMPLRSEASIRCLKTLAKLFC